jgi:hypothetical protein
MPVITPKEREMNKSAFLITPKELNLNRNNKNAISLTPKELNLNRNNVKMFPNSEEIELE